MAVGILPLLLNGMLLEQLTLMVLIQKARHCAFCFADITRYHYQPHYTVVETETERVSDLPKITQLVRGNTEI